MPDKDFGWLNLTETAHKCAKPYLWFAKPGQRWRCGKKLDNGERCGRTYVVGQHPTGEQVGKKIWIEESREPDAGLERFVRVADQELMYWVVDTLADQASVDPARVEKGAELFPVRQVLEAVRQHFEIGKVR